MKKKFAFFFFATVVIMFVGLILFAPRNEECIKINDREDPKYIASFIPYHYNPNTREVEEWPQTTWTTELEVVFLHTVSWNEDNIYFSDSNHQWFKCQIEGENWRAILKKND